VYFLLKSLDCGDVLARGCMPGPAHKHCELFLPSYIYIYIYIYMKAEPLAMVLLARMLTSLDSSGSMRSTNRHLWTLLPHWQWVCVLAGNRYTCHIGARAHWQHVGCNKVAPDLFVGMGRAQALFRTATPLILPES